MASEEFKPNVIATLRYDNYEILANSLLFDDEFYNCVEDCVDCAPELVVLFTKFYFTLKEKVQKKILEIIERKDINNLYYRFIIKHENSINDADYNHIISSIMNSYSSIQLIRSKLLKIPAKSLISFLKANDSLENILIFVPLFDRNSCLLYYLFSDHKSFNSKTLEILVGLINNGYKYSLDENQMIKEMLETSSDQFYKTICFLQPESDIANLSPSHILSKNNEIKSDANFGTQINAALHLK
ncbi:hypothetical protein NUSPORA_01953 [Nucleospora cyclopteri]